MFTHNTAEKWMDSNLPPVTWDDESNTIAQELLNKMTYDSKFYIQPYSQKYKDEEKYSQ